MEYLDLLDAGYTKGQAEYVLNYRKIAAREYHELSKSFGALVDIHQKYGKSISGEIKNLWEALQEHGDLRGSYVPRIRKKGSYEVWAKKDDTNPIFETFDTKLMAMMRERQLKKEGYIVNLKKSDALNQSVHGNIDINAINSIIQDAFENMEKEVNLSDLGLEGKWIKYPLKNGNIEEHYVISGDAKQYNNILKILGGQFYENQWHFLGKEHSFENTLKKTIAESKGIEIIDTGLMSNITMNNLAEIIRSKGSRSQMNSRNGKTGIDVYQGYETDSLKALTMSVSAIAGGTSKTNVSKQMVSCIMGTDVDFDTFESENRSDNFEPGTKGYQAESIELWHKYMTEVRNRRIDARKQPKAYTDAIEYHKDFLRNQESSERVIGAIKGVAAFKFLSGISSGLINLTTLVTAVPASMRAYGNIAIHRSPILIKRAMTNYAKVMMEKNESMSWEDQWLFNEIQKNGWDTALMNEEAMSTVQTWGGKAWNTLMSKALIVFSTTEKINRASTIAGAYYGLIENHKGELSVDQKHKDLEQAKEISDKAHGVYGKANLPSWARGANMGSQVGRMFYMYKTYIHKYFQTMGDILFRKKDYKALGWMLLSPAIVAGADATLIPIIARAIASVIPGWDEPDDIVEEFYTWLGDSLGETSETLARYGVAGLLGINIKGSMGISLPNMSSVPDITDILGANYGLFEDIIGGFNNIANGQYLKGIEELSPRFVRVYHAHTENIIMA